MLPCSTPDRLRQAVRCGAVEELPVIGKQAAKRRFAQAVRLFQNRVEHRSKVAGRRIDDLQHLRGRGLLFQRFLRLGDQTRVLHRDDCLGSEVLQEGDLLIGKRADFLAKYDDNALDILILEKRHQCHGTRTSEVHYCPAVWVIRTIEIAVLQIEKMDEPFPGQYPSGTALRTIVRGGLPHEFGVFHRYSAKRRMVKPRTVIGQQNPESGFAQP